MTELRRAHTVLGNAGPGSGGGRPPMAGTRQVNEALVLRVVTEFQGFVRDLLDLTVASLVLGSGVIRYRATLSSAMIRDRWIDRGNPYLDTLRKDTERLGIASLASQLQARNPMHERDTRLLRELVELRNALAHDDRDRLRRLFRQGVRPNIGFVTAAHACLDRYARALDEVVWDHLSGLFPAVDPWSPS